MTTYRVVIDDQDRAHDHAQPWTLNVYRENDAGEPDEDYETATSTGALIGASVPDVLDQLAREWPRWAGARIAELKAEWSRSTEAENPDDYALSQDDWSVGLGDDGAAEIVALLDGSNR
jgi:hypothetical protein